MGLTVVPLVGPSAPLLALMASGMGGQSFRFRGYLPQDAAARREAIGELQKEARRGVTQVFIETPYRNTVLLKAFLELGEPDLTLAIAADLTLETESVIARTIDQWRRGALPDLDRRPAVFVLGAPEAVSEASRSRSRR
jgi:16S rRNA (cytidine1402-2'-O)-methyltransferase